MRPVWMQLLGRDVFDTDEARHASQRKEAMAEVAENIKALGDQLAGLTIKQAVDLKDYLKETYNIEPAAGGVVMAGGGGAGAAAAAPVEEAKSTFDVVLKAAG